MDKTMILKPRLSEKSYGQSQVLNTYAFDVPSNASKQSVANAIVAQFEVEVIKVNIAKIKGKNKRTFINRRGRFVRGQRSNVKKAYVTLKEGNKLPIFAQEEEAEAKAAKAEEKAAKKAAKEKK
jgi:large subunit ribosomal protein L23